jgi:hypothetical protein
MAKRIPDLRMKTEQPSSHKNKPEQGVAPYGAQGAPRLNADVRQEAVNFSNGLLSATGNEELSTIAFIIRTKTPGGQI